jgi:hypothetical protein
MQNLRALVDEKLANNRNHRGAMLAAIASGEIIAFVGAGLSVPLKYPSWPDLMQKMSNHANGFAQYIPSEAAKADILEYAEEICNHFKAHNKLDEFKNIIGREFAPKAGGANCTATYELLAQLPFRAFVTTNYESCLEQAFANNAIKKGKAPNVGSWVVIKKGGQDRHRVSSFLRSIAEVSGERRLAYLHGRYDDTDNIVLTTSDYVECYGIVLNNKQPKDISVTLHYKFVWSLFATRKMVFFGCSMDDPYIKIFLDKVARDLWEQNQISHFIVLPIDEQSASLADGWSQQFLRYGLQPIFFDNRNGDFSKLDQLLDETSEHCIQVNSHLENFSMSNREIFPVNPIIAPRKSFVEKIISAISKLAKPFRQDVTSHQPAKSNVDAERPVNPDWLEEINITTAKDLKKNEN